MISYIFHVVGFGFQGLSQAIFGLAFFYFPVSGLIALLAARTIGIVAGLLTSVAAVPQLVKLWKEKKAEEVSTLFLLVLIAGLALWVWYAVKKTDLVLLFANVFSGTVNLIILFLKFWFSKKQNNNDRARDNS